MMYNVKKNYGEENMLYKDTTYRSIILIFISIMLLNPLIQITTSKEITGFDKGVSWRSVVPLKKVNFVNFDGDSFLDDYGYLASIPASVFYDKNENRIYSYPLLYYQDSYPIKEDKERSLNARQGLDYFMEDWMGYCNGRLDGMTLINVPKEKVKQWPSRNITIISDDDPYSIASQIALNDWSYSDTAVIAVIQEKYGNPNNFIKGELRGSLPASKVGYKQFKMEQPDIGTGGTYKSFDIKDSKYKYVIAMLTWSNKIDLDLQLYDTHLGMVDAGMTDVYEQSEVGLREVVGSFIHNLGEWRLSITAVPKKSWGSEVYSDFKVLSNNKKANVDIKLLPGVIIKLPGTPFGCRDARFKLKWDNPNIRLGFTLIDPAGTEIASSISREGFLSGDISYRKPGETNITVTELGECREDENYSICVFSLDNTSSIDFTLEYSWHQNYSRMEGEELSSASNGAVLASKLNAPLLYMNSSSLPRVTENTLYKLGVKQIYLIDIGSHLKDSVREKLSAIWKVVAYSTAREIYDAIKDGVDDNSIVFTTIDPWSYWYVEELKPAGEYRGALFIGPASYIAAHHCTPVVIVDIHPRLSQAVVYPTNFWTPASHKVEPCSSSMMLFGKEVYQFLEDYNLGKLEPDGPEAQDKESIITVAGQYDIGASWDRVFVGKAVTGRFSFSPVDSAYWICRDVFYPALIFENPALDPIGIQLENGSKSRRGPLGKLRIFRPSEKNIYKYPVLESFMPVYIHRFNERASKYWGFVYQCADGIVPGVTVSNNPIDDGVNLIYKGEAGSFWPDLSETDYVPFYMSRCGYSNVFSTNFDITMENVNRGCILWIVGTHGDSFDGGSLNFPDSDSIFFKEKNPWRGYEWFYGSTEEPDTMTTEIHGIIPMLLGNPNWNGIFRTALDFAPAKRPLLDLIGKIAGLPILRLLTPKWLQDTQDYYDGIVGSAFLSKLGTIPRTGLEIDDSLKNIHSCAFITAACLPAYKYLHLAMVRHGSSFQIIDPWGTSWYSSFWEATIPRDIALGDTIGEAYAKGMAHVGILYLGGGGYNGEKPQWWWDKSENVCLFGDPDMRVWIPSTEYSDANHWEQKDVQSLKYDPSFNVDGHSPFGVTSYPHEYRGAFMINLLSLIIITVIAILIGTKLLVRHSKVE